VYTSSTTLPSFRSSVISRPNSCNSSIFVMIILI
jgi:hypothetical protein